MSSTIIEHVAELVVVPPTLTNNGRAARVALLVQAIEALRQALAGYEDELARLTAQS